MVSLLEQYETETQRTSEYSDESVNIRFNIYYLKQIGKLTNFKIRSGGGYIQAAWNANENEDIFKSHRVNIK